MDQIGARLQDVWNGILGLLSQLVIPDWAGLVALIPVGISALVALYVAWLIVRFLRAGPTSRGMRPVRPLPPPGVHEGRPSFAPLFAALGAFVVFLGLVAHGVAAVVLGVVALVLTLLYWGREAMLEYDRLETPGAALPAVPPEPPPGVHMPGPSFRPLLAAIGTTVLFFGLAFGAALLVAGLIVLAVTLLGWLRDARAEYRDVEEADRTGHLPSHPAPAYPVGTLALIAVIVALGLVVNAGIIPPRSSAGTPSGPAASGAPRASAAPSPAPAADVTIEAKNIAFVQATVAAPAGKPFTIAFVNSDPGVPHNVAISEGSPGGQEIWKGDIITGVKTTVYQVPALPAGTYGFACTVHPNMTGTLTVK